MKIALFGGAFDPPHLGHRVVAQSLVDQQVVDEVWFVPVFKHPWAKRYGKQQLVNYDLRVKMLELSITGLRGVKVKHYKDVSFTFNTLEYFSKQKPDYQFSWVMGSEYLARFDDFLAGHPDLIKYPFYIYPRAGYKFTEKLKKDNMTFLKDFPEIAVSSTQVKKLIMSHNDFAYLVVEPVAKLILANQLYL